MGTLLGLAGAGRGGYGDPASVMAEVDMEKQGNVNSHLILDLRTLNKCRPSERYAAPQARVPRQPRFAPLASGNQAVALVLVVYRNCLPVLHRQGPQWCSRVILLLGTQLFKVLHPITCVSSIKRPLRQAATASSGHALRTSMLGGDDG